MGVAGLSVRARGPEQSESSATSAGLVVLKRSDFVRSLRLTGTVEAVEATTITAPRLAGQNNNTLVIMSLIRAGQAVRPGDPLVEFDRQEQIRNSLDRQAELNDFDQQILQTAGCRRMRRAPPTTAL